MIFFCINYIMIFHRYFHIFLFGKKFTSIRQLKMLEIDIYRVEIMCLNFRINFMDVTTLSLYLSIQALHKLFP